MSSINQSLLLSLKPCYADPVFEGHKKIELRRRIAAHIENFDVFVYVSSPVKQLRGGFSIEEVWTGTPEDLWSRVSKLAGVDRNDFDAYYEGLKHVYALKITNVWEYKCPENLQDLRRRFPNFVVPQSWRFVKDEEYESFRKMERMCSSEY